MSTTPGRKRLRRSLAIGASFALVIGLGSTGSVLAASPTSASPRSAGPSISDASKPLNLGHVVPSVSSARAKTSRVGTVNVRDLAAKPTSHPAVMPGALPAWHGQPAKGQPSGTTPAVAPPSPVLATAVAHPDLATASWSGLAEGASDTAGEPADPSIAVGPDIVAEASDDAIQFAGRTGGLAPSGPFSASIDIADFFAVPSDVTFVASPRVIYDAPFDRWIATESSWHCTSGPDGATGAVDIAVSDTGDPTGTWTIYRYGGFAGILPTDPHIGWSSTIVAIATSWINLTADPTDCLAGASFMTADILVNDWADLIRLPQSIVGTDLQDASNFFYRPAPPAANPTPFESTTLVQLIYEDQGDSGTSHDVGWAVIAGDNANFSVAMFGHVDLTTAGEVSAFGDPTLLPVPRQPGSPGTIGSTGNNPVDERPLNVVIAGVLGTLLTFSSNYPCIPAGDTITRDCVRITQLDLDSGSPPDVVEDTVLGSDGLDLFGPGVGATAEGSIQAFFTGSSPAIPPSVFSSFQLAGDPPNSMTAPALVVPGSGAYGGTKWGPGVGIALDAQDPGGVWAAGSASVGGDWTTAVVNTHLGGLTYVPIKPVRVLNTKTGLGVSSHLVAGVPRELAVAGFPFSGTGSSTIPFSAAAISANLTVVGPTGAGYVSVTPLPTTSTGTSSLNFPAGATRANNLIASLDQTGALSIVYRASGSKTTDAILDVTGYFIAMGGSTFQPVAPVRVINTKANVGITGNLKSGTAKTVVLAGTHGIPMNATAITGNLAVTGQTAAGYVSVTKTATSAPTTSTINFPATGAAANGLIAPLSPAGGLSVVYRAAHGATTDVILDLTGYFVPGTGGLTFHPLTPARRMDTRLPVSSTLPGTGNGLTGAFSSSAHRVLDVDGHLGVPTGAAAITGNLTVTSQTAGGFVSIAEDGTDSPTTSTLNFVTGDNRANGVIAPLASGLGSIADGDVSIVYVAAGTQTTQIILDITGYFQ